MKKKLGQKIREYRLKRGITQEELAEKLLSKKSTISEYENNKIDIKISILREIAKVLGTPLSHLLSEEDDDIDGYGIKPDKKQGIKKGCNKTGNDTGRNGINPYF